MHLASGWTAGPIAVIIAAIYPLLLTTPSGYRTIVWSVLIATVPALVMAFQLVPQFATFPMLALAIAPFLIATFMLIGLDGLYRTAGVNALLLLLIPLDPVNVQTYDFATALDSIAGVILSFSVCALVVLLIDPETPWLLRLRLRRAAARTLRRAANDTAARAQRSQMRLTFLTSEIAPAFRDREPDPYRETEAGYAIGHAASACEQLYAGLTPDLPWAADAAALRERMARIGMTSWSGELDEMIAIVERGASRASDFIRNETDGRAYEAAAAFRIVLHALRIQRALQLGDPVPVRIDAAAPS